MASLITFLLLVVDIFWLAWFVSVRIDVLFRNSEHESKFIENWMRKEQHWLLRAIGLLFYAPYSAPIRSILIFAAVTGLLVFLMRTS